MFAGSKYFGFGRERCRRRVLDPLVDRQDRHVAGPASRPCSTCDARLRITCGERSLPATVRSMKSGPGSVNSSLVMPFATCVSKLSDSSPSKLWMSTIAPPCKIGPATVVARRLRRSAEPGAGVLDDRRDLLGSEAVGEGGHRPVAVGDDCFLVGGIGERLHDDAGERGSETPAAVGSVTPRTPRSKMAWPLSAAGSEPVSRSGGSFANNRITNDAVTIAVMTCTTRTSVVSQGTVARSSGSRSCRRTRTRS